MADTEEYFPRGGKKPIVQHFKQSSNFLGAPEKSEKKKRKQKKKSEDDDGYLSDELTKNLDESYKNCAVGLSYTTIKPGVLILGRVRNAHETRINMMLPNRMMGTVMACHVSEPYNKLLEAYVNDQTDHVRELPSMFQPGQYVAVKVLEADGDHVMLSMMPQHVNGGKTSADLHGGCIIQAAVSSVEDHGYVMDIGIPHTRAFLPKKNANPELELETGMLTWVAVRSSDNSVVTLSGHLDSLQKAVLRKTPSTPLGPGSQVLFTVDAPLDNGIEGHIFKDTTCYVQRQHADVVRGKKPNLGQKVLARVLYVMPTRNTPFLTLKNIFESTHPDLEKEQKYKEGDIIENAQVLKITGRSVHFKLGKDSWGTLSLKRIQVDEDLSDEEVVSKSYPIGSSHRVRVVCYSLCDHVYSVSDRPAALAERYFCAGQLRAGQPVAATVRAVRHTSLTLAVGRVTGFVPHAHMYDSGIFIDPKKANTSKQAKTKYKVGQQVKARVLSVDLAKQTVILTLKPSLLPGPNSEDLEVLSSYDEAQIGKAYKGVIKHIRGDYILVSFFNNVTAYVHRHHVTRDAGLNLTEAFHVGQIVNCTIMKVDVEGKKMTGSLTVEPFWPAEKPVFSEKRIRPHDIDEMPNKKQRTDSESSEIGKSKKKDKSNHREEILTESKKDRKKKDKKSSVSESEEVVTDVDMTNKVKKKNKKSKNSNEDENKKDGNRKKNKDVQQVEDTNSEKKKKHKIKTKIAEDLDNVENEDDDDTAATRRKKIKVKKSLNTKNKESDTDDEKCNTKKPKKSKKNEASEESDAIETDIYDSDQVISPQDLALIDLSDCLTIKQFKRRIICLLKAIKARTTRIDRIQKKIAELEERGLNSKSKKYHNAMHTEKFLVEQRIKKMLDALTKAQGKLIELGDSVIKKTEFIRKKDLKRERKVSAQEDKAIDRNHNESKVKLIENKIRKLNIQVADNLAPALEVPSAKHFWSANADSLTKNVKEEESSSSEDEPEEQPKKKRKKLTVAEKVAKVRAEEERVRDLERRAIESEARPRSSEQFERALLARPACSQLWIAYMAFHLQATEIEKARSVGRKALTTINFREELERLNVWLALLNCEHRFGTKESQQKTLEEALQTNDTFKVHSNLLDILVDTGKHQELSSLVDLMLRKYKRDPQNYIICGGACFKLNMVDKARQVMQKAISLLEKKEHVNVIVQFALMERAHGAAERAESLFEQILAVYPQRTDICGVYADMLVKTGDADRIRQVMERITSQSLPARKMKVLYKKWIEVEEKLGDKEEVEKIKQRAMDFIDKAKF